MVFEDSIEIISRGRKATSLTDFNKESVTSILSTVFDGMHNRKEILESLSWLEKNTDDLKSIMDSVGLEKWYYQDMKGTFRVQSAKFILRLGLNESDDLDTVVLGELERDKKPMAGDVAKDMKKILGSYKSLMKEFNNARK